MFYQMDSRFQRRYVCNFPNYNIGKMGNYVYYTNDGVSINQVKEFLNIPCHELDYNAVTKNDCATKKHGSHRLWQH